MWEKITEIGRRTVKGVIIFLVAITRGFVHIITHDYVKNGLLSGAQMTLQGVTILIFSIAGFIGTRYPALRKVVKTGIIGGFRMFRSQFNKNGPNMVRNTRKWLSPLEWISVGAALVISLFAPIVGVTFGVVTYIAFFRDADTLPLTTFSMDSIGIDGVIGIGAAMLVNLFKFIGALRTTFNWLLSQFT